MSLAALLALSLVGFAVGFLAGLVGIGGGVLIVPFLYFFYGHATWSGVNLAPELHAIVASATSLFIIVPTAIVGSLTYARSRLVAWRVAMPVALFSMVAAAATAVVAERVPPELLKVSFGAFLMFTGVQLVRKRAVREPQPMRMHPGLMAMSGAVVGTLSALLGVGGGLVAIPLLLYAVRLDVERVAATSLAIVAFAATAGTLSYMAAGEAGSVQLPIGSIGYVHVLAAIPMLPGAMMAARWGAKMNQRMDAARLRIIFSIIFILLGARLVIANFGELIAR
ncbi:MAG: sulfite exporter TauE/SafE family protein [Gemmatimonadota bacterium]